MKVWEKAEQHIAKTLGGRLVAGSGSSPMGGRGDVRAGRFLIEVKSTTGRGIRVTDKLLDKTAQRATKEGLDPALALDVNGKYWVAVPFDWFARIVRAQQMMDELKKQNKGEKKDARQKK